MMLPLTLSAIAILLVFIAMVDALTQRLALPQSVTLAALGITCGAFATFGTDVAVLAPLAQLFSGLPLSADKITLLLLPPLLFDAALKIDARRMADDAATIFLLAVVAVCLTTFAVGFALAPLGLQPLLVCLLLGAIVSTTDPLAVLSIFRDVGAPSRINRIVEGESLLNDAAAIALFTILLGAVDGSRAVSFGDGVAIFLISGIGGIALGLLTGAAGGLLMALVEPRRAALTSVTVALPYLTYVAAESLVGVSGAMAVVAAGLVTASRARSGRSPVEWRHALQTWDQISFWSNSLVFVLAAFLVPTLLTDFSAMMALAVGVVISAILVARGLVLWLVLPLLQGVSLAQRMGHRARMILWWGGLRGALTLVLALSVTEEPGVPQEAREFIAVLATAVTLLSILANGLTLRPLMRLLGLHKLSAFDRTLSDGARALATASARSTLARAAERWAIAPAVAAAAAETFADRGGERGGSTSARERLLLALVVLAQAERTALIRHNEKAVVSPRVGQRLHRDVQRLREAARAGGRRGYLDAALRLTDFTVTFRAALLIQRRTGLRAPLARALGEHVECLLVRRILIRELGAYVDERIAPVLGARIGALCHKVLGRREADVSGALAALALQYPHYVDALERQFLEREALSAEAREYALLREEGLISAEVSSALSAERRRANARAAKALNLDLSVDKRALIRQLPAFADLPEAGLRDVASALSARFVTPGERIITKGERDDTVYFIVSGAVEIDTGRFTLRRGRGTCVGELAAVSGAPRSAHVTMLGFGELLVLSGHAFRRLMENNAAIRAHVEAVVAERAATAASGPKAAQ